MGEQSGDRQRREKGPPILKAEKGEHERAPSVGESYLTPLRATLRAPPSKWAIKGFFPAGERSEPRSRTAPEGSLPTERGQTVPALRPELDDPNLFGVSNRSAPADRSPRPREAEGRLAPEMAESHEARSQAQAQRRAWPQCIATWAASGVAVPQAFFGTFFRFERKYSPLRVGSPTVRAVVGASGPHSQVGA